MLAATTGGDAQAQRETVLEFRLANDEDVATFMRAVGDADLPQMSRSCHRMLGAGLIVGAHSFAAVCERLGRACRGGDWSAIHADLAIFQQEWLDLNSHFDQLASASPQAH
jgi:HPt (histidine-containing phosphotransfer) domain-containing protein